MGWPVNPDPRRQPDFKTKLHDCWVFYSNLYFEVGSLELLPFNLIIARFFFLAHFHKGSHFLSVLDLDEGQWFSLDVFRSTHRRQSQTQTESKGTAKRIAENRENLRDTSSEALPVEHVFKSHESNYSSSAVGTQPECRLPRGFARFLFQSRN